MNMESILDVLKFAISKEQASEQFYKELSAEMTDSAAKSIFQVIAKQEQHHAEALKLEIMKAGFTYNDEDPLGSDSEYEWDEHLELGDDARDMGYVDALLLAIQKERAAFGLYAQLVGMTRDLELRKLLLELAEEEMRHVLQFEREYETVTHQED